MCLRLYKLNKSLSLFIYPYASSLGNWYSRRMTKVHAYICRIKERSSSQSKWIEPSASLTEKHSISLDASGDGRYEISAGVASSCSQFLSCNNARNFSIGIWLVILFFDNIAIRWQRTASFFTISEDFSKLFASASSEVMIRFSSRKSGSICRNR